MVVYILQRVMLTGLMLFGLVCITFLVSNVAPSDPAALAAGPDATRDMIETIRREYGLDQPLWQQFIRYVSDLASGNFGRSIVSTQSVGRELAQFFPATLELVLLAMGLGVLLGVPLGMLSAVYKNRPIDHVVRVFAVSGVALPAFWFGLVLQLVFAAQLDLLPTSGRLDIASPPPPPITRMYLIDSLLAGDMVAFRDAAAHIVLPLATLTLANLPLVARTTRNLMVEALSEDFVRTAFAYSLPRRLVYFRYALKATLIPLLTVIGLTYGYLLGGAVVAEYVFDWPGIGGYVVRAITQSDYPAAIGVTTFLAAAYLTINLIVDLLYFAVDPRLRRA